MDDFSKKATITIEGPKGKSFTFEVTDIKENGDITYTTNFEENEDSGLIEETLPHILAILFDNIISSIRIKTIDLSDLADADKATKEAIGMMDILSKGEA